MWWLIAPCAAALAWVGIKFVLPALVGKSISVQAAGRYYLNNELKKWNIRQFIPDACVGEVADHVTTFYAEFANRRGAGPMWAKTEMLSDLERDARVILEWTRGRDIAGDRIQYISAALKKYGVPLGVGNSR